VHTNYINDIMSRHWAVRRALWQLRSQVSISQTVLYGNGRWAGAHSVTSMVVEWYLHVEKAKKAKE